MADWLRHHQLPAVLRPVQRRSNLGARLSPALSDPARFIRANLRLEPARGFDDIRLFTAHPASGLGRLEAQTGAAPYWAYVWSGGAALARHIATHPQVVAGRRVLDLGCGCGIVAIAAARAGAASVHATDLDPFALAATALNAEANGAAVALLPLVTLPLPVDLVLAGDVFYDARASRRSIALLDAIRSAGIEVLVGDPGRKHLPVDLLRKLGDYEVPEFGGASVTASVYAYRP